MMVHGRSDSMPGGRTFPSAVPTKSSPLIYFLNKRKPQSKKKKDLKCHLSEATPEEIQRRNIEHQKVHLNHTAIFSP